MAKKRTVLRGMTAMKRVSDAMKNRKGGGDYKPWQFMLAEGESAVIRFRGLQNPVAERYTEKELLAMDADDLVGHALELQTTYKEDMTQAVLAQSCLDRYDAVEPCIYANHYVKRNKGHKGTKQVFNCGDSYAANMGTMREDTDCRACTARMQGDDGIGWPRTTVAYSVWDYRSQHALVRKDGSKEYVECTMDEEEWCEHCAFNDKQSDDKAKRRLYQKKLRVTEFSSTVGAVVDTMSARVGKICRDCRTGKIKTDEVYCPGCEESYDLSDLREAGWNPNAPVAVECPHCKVEAVPVEIAHCTKCDGDGKRTRLCDITVLAQRIDSKTWTFTENLQAQPLDPEDELDAQILATPLADLEAYSEAPSVADQMRNCGLDEDNVKGDSEPEETTEEEEERPPRGYGGARSKKKTSVTRKKSGSPFGVGKGKAAKPKAKGGGIRRT